MPGPIQPRQFGQILALAGATLAVLGLLPWAALVVGTAGAGDASLLVLAGVAVVGGSFLALVGIGFQRRVDAVQRAADERRLDAAVLAAAASAQGTADDCGQSCSTCTASCALDSLR